MLAVVLLLGPRLSLVPHGLEAPPPTPSHHKLADLTYYYSLILILYLLNARRIRRYIFIIMHPVMGAHRSYVVGGGASRQCVTRRSHGNEDVSRFVL